MSENLFGFPVRTIRIDPDSYDKDKIVSDIKKNYEIDNNRNEWGTSNLHHTYGDWDNEKFIDINYNKLKLVYQKTFDNFFDNNFKHSQSFSFQWNIVNYTAIKTGQHMQSHTHPSYDFSCTHYINFNPEKHSSIRFVNSSPMGLYGKEIMESQFNIVDNTDISNSYLQGLWNWPVNEDYMVIFPATLQHEVPKQEETDELRICIVTNIKLMANSFPRYDAKNT